MNDFDSSILTSEDDDFHRLPAERQDAIAQAAIEVFGRNDYKSASTDAIARSAGISKGLLFFYCKSKRQLYLRAMEYLYDKAVEVAVDDGFWEIDDFFELMEYASSRKMALMRRLPWALAFSIRAFYPEHRDIKDTMDRWTQRQTDVMFERFFKNVDWGRFRDDVDPRHVLDMIIWLADGWMHQRRTAHEPIDLDALMTEYLTWSDMLRTWAYKPEYVGKNSRADDGEVRP